MLQAVDRLHHHVEGTDVFFSDAVAQTKRNRDSCILYKKDVGESLKEVYVDLYRKRRARFNFIYFF